MKTKTTQFHWQGMTASADITVSRQQGYFTERVFNDGDSYNKQTYTEGAQIMVLFAGKRYYGQLIETRGHKCVGFDDEKGKGRLIAVGEEMYNAIDAACKEELGESQPAKPAKPEMSDEEREDLTRKAREYDNAFNEGGYGYNPYRAKLEASGM